MLSADRLINLPVGAISTLHPAFFIFVERRAVMETWEVKEKRQTMSSLLKNDISISCPVKRESYTIKIFIFPPYKTVSAFLSLSIWQKEYNYQKHIYFFINEGSK
jgi:hypothetical protein